MKICEIEGCEKKVHARGWCQMHYIRVNKHNDINVGKLTPIERLESGFIKNEDECWNWFKSKSEKGYGKIRFNGKKTSPHRVSWSLYIGEIPKGMNVLHKCDNPSCVNPGHLFLGTQKDNMIDMMKKGRSNKAKGESVKSSKLKIDDIVRIRDLISEKYSQSYIAEKFNVSQTAISHIVIGKTWSHVE